MAGNCVCVCVYVAKDEGEQGDSGSRDTLRRIRGEEHPVCTGDLYTRNRRDTRLLAKSNTDRVTGFPQVLSRTYYTHVIMVIIHGACTHGRCTHTHTHRARRAYCVDGGRG